MPLPFPLAFGCWRIATANNDAADLETSRRAVMAAVEAGYTVFDLADIYCKGRSETFFGKVLAEQPVLRAKLTVATKCGIRFAGEPEAEAPYRYDSTYEHIVASCEQSLRRLGIETIDLYQLHRPDWLMEPAEVARAFEQLSRSGKVRAFGVSNFRPRQVELLQNTAGMPKLTVNQIEVSLLQLRAFADGTIDQCQRLGMQPLAWSPLGGGHLGQGPKDVLRSQEGYNPGPVAALLDEMAAQHRVTRTAVALAWLLRHPAKIMPIVGSTQPERIRAAATAVEVHLSHVEWYRLLTAAHEGPLP